MELCRIRSKAEAINLNHKIAKVFGLLGKDLYTCKIYGVL